MNKLLNQIQAYRHAATDHFEGYVDPRFIDLATQFSRLQDARSKQGGAALAVYFHGQKVVDIFTGQKTLQEKWQADTLSVCYSTGKGVLATLAHILVSRGLIEYDVPVAHYWPEFAQNGKEKITLADMLKHQSGLFDIRNIIDDATEMLDWRHMLHRIATAKPRFEAGTDAAYQPLSFGWQVGGALEKATGQSLAELMDQYLVQPLALDSAFFGVPEQQLGRLAYLISNPKQEPAKTKKKSPSLIDKLLQYSGQNPQDFQDAMIPKGMKKVNFLSDEGVRAVIPAANGVFSAENLARIYAMLANQGQWQGQTIISSEQFARLSQIQYRHRDRIMPIPMHWRLGYHRILTLGKSSQGFGHMGFNGSGAWCDPKRHLSFAYTHNFATASITGDYRLWALSQQALACADQILTGRKTWF